MTDRRPDDEPVAPDYLSGPVRDPDASDDDEHIRVHLRRQEGVPEGFVRLDTGLVVPVGGNADNADPEPDAEAAG